MKDSISISQWIEKFDRGNFDSPDIDTQISAGWYDWFCKDGALRNKTYKLAPKIKRIAKILGEEFCDSHYVFFKNNCPLDGSLYDDFRFCDMKTGDVIYTISPSLGYRSLKGKSEVWGAENKFKNSLVTGNWNDVVAFFQTKRK